MGKFSAEQSCREFYVRLSTLRQVEAFCCNSKSVHTLRCLRLSWALLVWAKIRLITWKSQVAMIKSTLLISFSPAVGLFVRSRRLQCMVRSSPMLSAPGWSHCLQFTGLIAAGPSLSALAGFRPAVGWPRSLKYRSTNCQILSSNLCTYLSIVGQVQRDLVYI